MNLKNIKNVKNVKDIEDINNQPEWHPDDIELFKPNMVKLRNLVTNEYFQVSDKIERTKIIYSVMMDGMKGKLNKSKSKMVNKKLLIILYKLCLADGIICQSSILEKWIRVKPGRSDSGIISFTFVFAPGDFSCPEDCDYCPNDPKTTRSYLRGEPAVDRAAKVDWKMVEQFDSRANQLYEMGHDIDKLELNFEGGTIMGYPPEYIEEAFRDVFYAANTFMKFRRPKLTLVEEQTINETSSCRIIGATIETRPDRINKQQLTWFRYLGVTRIQLGVQNISDIILNNVNRNCPTRKVVYAMELCLSNGFKVDNHWMPDLPGSTHESDMMMFRWLCGDPETHSLPDDPTTSLYDRPNDVILADHWKIYPMMVLPYTKVKIWYENGQYVPREPKYIDELLIYIESHCPKQIRINRIVRDFAKKDIIAGTNDLGLRDKISKIIKSRGLKQTDIRSREVKGGFIDIPDSKIWIKKFRSSKGTEYFISLEDSKEEILYGFIRLRFNDSDSKVYFDVLKKSAIIRELHVYGNLVAHSKKGDSKETTQHLGIGQFLMWIAEKISFENGYSRISIIAGIGVRNYYAKKCGYHLKDTYMTKILNKSNNYRQYSNKIWNSKMDITLSVSKLYYIIILFLTIIIFYEIIY